MTTQPLARWRPRSIESRPAPRLATIVVILAISAVLFTVGFALARPHAGAAGVQRGTLPQPLPALASPVPESLATVPAIEVGVNGGRLASTRPPATRQSASPPALAAGKPVAAQIAPAPTPASPSAESTPAVTTPAVTPQVATPPAVRAPAPSTPAAKPPASKAPSGGSSPSGGGPGTSFDTSG